MRTPQDGVAKGDRIGLRVTPALKQQIDARRGPISMTAYLSRLIQADIRAPHGSDIQDVGPEGTP